MLPRDPDILFSLLNAKLRDFYPSLEALCDDMDEDRAALTEIMEGRGYVYDSDSNSFISKRGRD